MLHRCHPVSSPPQVPVEQAGNLNILLPCSAGVCNTTSKMKFDSELPRRRPPEIPVKNECAAQCRWSAHGRTAELRACIRLARSRYFALVFCGDTGLERGSKPDQGLSPTRSVWRFHVPRIWNVSIGLGKKAVKRKSQNLGKIFRQCLYLVVAFPGEPISKMEQSGVPVRKYFEIRTLASFGNFSAQCTLVQERESAGGMARASRTLPNS